jgi:hypothetical protein
MTIVPSVPPHTLGLVEDTVNVGFGFTVIVVVVDAEQPFPSV